jgi:hypothetical protein
MKTTRPTLNEVLASSFVAVYAKLDTHYELAVITTKFTNSIDPADTAYLVESGEYFVLGDDPSQFPQKLPLDLGKKLHAYDVLVERKAYATVTVMATDSEDARKQAEDTPVVLETHSYEYTVSAPREITPADEIACGKAPNPHAEFDAVFALLSALGAKKM